ncbi:hypothetical protein HA466_0321230 [Hirschfeldia incana]|nr:hypothetical protein HA466_0321230 [Hirschfeldia incana]
MSFRGWDPGIGEGFWKGIDYDQGKVHGVSLWGDRSNRWDFDLILGKESFGIHFFWSTIGKHWREKDDPILIFVSFRYCILANKE